MTDTKTSARLSLDMIDLRLLAYFKSVAEFGSITRAAIALHMTQPTLSRQLTQLEQIVGHRLFTRTPRGAVLTPAGERLRDHTDILNAQVERIPEILLEGSSQRQVVSLGIPSGMPDEWFVAFRAELQGRAPNVALSLHDMNTREQHALLAKQGLDIGLMHTMPPELPSEWMFRQALGFAVRDPAAAEGKEHFSFADMHGKTVLAQSASSERTRLQARALQVGVSIEWRFRSFATHSRFIADSAGADAVFLSAATAARSFPTWKWLPQQSGSDTIHLHSWAAWWDDGSPNIRAVLGAMNAVRDIESTNTLYDASLSARPPERG